LPAITVSELLDRRRRWSKHFDLLTKRGIASLKFAELIRQVLCLGLHLGSLGSIKTQIDQPAERRIVEHAAKFAFGGKKTFVIVRDEIFDGVMVWRIRLHNNSAGLVASSSSPGDLAQKLKGPLSRAKVGQIQRKIGQ
jgi:hypothetical protein